MSQFAEKIKSIKGMHQQFAYAKSFSENKAFMEFWNGLNHKFKRIDDEGVSYGDAVDYFEEGLSVEDAYFEEWQNRY